MAQLIEDGCEFIGPEEGDLACGYQGPGRMAAIERILQKISQ
jgi:phosphopantothenoylcysteine decarboxylase